LTASQCLTAGLQMAHGLRQSAGTFEVECVHV
jgi:hypothetical protein